MISTSSSGRKWFIKFQYGCIKNDASLKIFLRLFDTADPSQQNEKSLATNLHCIAVFIIINSNDSSSKLWVSRKMRLFQFRAQLTRPNKLKHYCFLMNPMGSRDLVDTISSDINSPLIHLSSPFGGESKFFQKSWFKKKVWFWGQYIKSTEILRWLRIFDKKNSDKC